MDSAQLAERRVQMGRSIQSWVLANGPRAVGEVADGFWLVLTGSPGPDGNMALVHDGAVSTLDLVKTRLEVIGYPTLLMLADFSRLPKVGPRWEYGGLVPFMSLDLSEAHLAPDDRVRRAGAEDFDTVVRLVTEANPFGAEVAEVGVAILRAQVETPSIWILFDGGAAVSTVSTAHVDDAVCIWSMATPPPYGRRGYGRALLSHVLHEARSQGGARVGLLTASPPGRRLYEATGWSVLEQWSMFTSLGRADGSSVDASRTC